MGLPGLRLPFLSILTMPVSPKTGKRKFMPHDSTADLPASVKKALPGHAQAIYKKASTMPGTNMPARKAGVEKLPARKLPIRWPGAR
jgi:hypothetical protein